MLEGLGYVILSLAIIGSVLIAFLTHAYLWAFICFWIGLTVGAMMIIRFKES